jgi:hypothetical protein
LRRRERTRLLEDVAPLAVLRGVQTQPLLILTDAHAHHHVEHLKDSEGEDGGVAPDRGDAGEERRRLTPFASLRVTATCRRASSPT